MVNARNNFLAECCCRRGMKRDRDFFCPLLFFCANYLLLCILFYFVLFWNSYLSPRRRPRPCRKLGATSHTTQRLAALHNSQATNVQSFITRRHSLAHRTHSKKERERETDNRVRMCPLLSAAYEIIRLNGLILY